MRVAAIKHWFLCGLSALLLSRYEVLDGAGHGYLCSADRPISVAGPGSWLDCTPFALCSTLTLTKASKQNVSIQLHPAHLLVIALYHP